MTAMVLYGETHVTSGNLSIKSAKWRGSQHLGSTLSKDMTLNPAAVLHFFLNQTLHISVQKVMDNAARNAFDRLH